MWFYFILQFHVEFVIWSCGIFYIKMMMKHTGIWLYVCVIISEVWLNLKWWISFYLLKLACTSYIGKGDKYWCSLIVCGVSVCGFRWFDKPQNLFLNEKKISYTFAGWNCQIYKYFFLFQNINNWHFYPKPQKMITLSK